MNKMNKPRRDIIVLLEVEILCIGFKHMFTDYNFLSSCRYIDDLLETIPSICATFDKIKEELGVSHNENNPVNVRDDRMDGQLPTLSPSDRAMQLYYGPLMLGIGDYKVIFTSPLREEYMYLVEARVYSSYPGNVCCLDLHNQIYSRPIHGKCHVNVFYSEKENSNEMKENCVEDFLSVILELLSLQR